MSGKRWFISDTHFFHGKMISHYKRNGAFASIEEMNEFMIERWNSRIGKNDTVYFLGDFSFGTYEQTKEVLNRLNGKVKYFILGNHDKRTKRKISTKDWIDMGWTEINDEEVISLSNGHQVLLKHYPYQISALRLLWLRIKRELGPFKTYYAFYPVDKGLWHIHGHIHAGPRISGRQINVNVESWDYYPVSESAICKMINEVENRKILNRLKRKRKAIASIIREMKCKFFGLS